MGTIEELLQKAGYKFIGNQKEIVSLIKQILATKNIRFLKSIPFLLYKQRLSTDEIGELLINEDFKEIYGITQKIFEKEKIPVLIKKEITYNKFSFDEFYEDFLMQYRKELTAFDSQRIYKERDQEFWLSKLFTKKEKEIIKSILDNQEITKTEYEYFSRKTKKKCKAILRVYELAQLLAEKNPSTKKE